MWSILLGSNLDENYWSDALLYAVYIKNRLLHKAFNYEKSLHEAWTVQK